MIAAVRFRNFKALRATAVKLSPFNLLLGPNGSGKTSLIQALLRLRSLAALPVIPWREMAAEKAESPQVEFHFAAPYEQIRVVLGCSADELVCNLLAVDHPPGAEAAWAELRTKLLTIRAYLFDHYAIAQPAKASEAADLSSNGGNLAAVLAAWRAQPGSVFPGLEREFCRLMPEYAGLELRTGATGTVELGARLVAEQGQFIPAESLSQGTLYQLAILALAYNPRPPAVVCLEEADRGMHPRSLREVRDTLYRLSYPKDAGVDRAAVQVVATTHSPYLLDQFREHPEEVILASKHGAVAKLERLADRADLVELMKETHLGDLWYSGILGAVPGE
jgi:predicted ATPase